MHTRINRCSKFNIHFCKFISHLFWLAWLLWTLISHGVHAINVDLFTQDTPPPGAVGGMANAMIGSLLLTLVGVAVGTPVGLLAGTWLAEYGRESALASLIRFINDILLSAPSIVIGVFVYGVVVARTGHFSGWAGGIARISGETAPLLFTALNNQFRSTDMSQPMANLPVMIFQFAMSPYQGWQQLAWAGALMITAAILVLSILARFLLRSHSFER